MSFWLHKNMSLKQYVFMSFWLHKNMSLKKYVFMSFCLNSCLSVLFYSLTGIVICSSVKSAFVACALTLKPKVRFFSLGKL